MDTSTYYDWDTILGRGDEWDEITYFDMVFKHCLIGVNDVI